MSLHKEPKLQRMLENWPPGTIATAAWLLSQGISRQLRNRYLRSGWITALEQGAYQRKGDDVNWQGGIYALQTNAELPPHVGAITALSLQGMAHYLRIGKETVFLFCPARNKLPMWFKKHDWGINIQYVRTAILPKEIGLKSYQEKTFSFLVSGPERAILECLHLAPTNIDLLECYQILEGLTTLRPTVLQSLLEQCTSIKVKRLFLYMANKAKHEWYTRLDSTKLSLGTGVRTITKGGVHDKQFNIIVPKGLTNL